MDVRLRNLLLAAAGLVLIVHSLAYNFVTDDAYISFVFSRNFAEHGELAFNLGDPVEGYTNFLWTLVLGVLMLVGIPPELSSRVLGTACALGTLILVVRIVDRSLSASEPAGAGNGAPRTASPWAIVPPLLLATSSGFACWTSGGLETQLFTVLVAGALDALVEAPARRRALRRAGALLALASMTRPEGPLVAGVFGLVWIAYRALGFWRAPAGSDRRLLTRDELFAAAWFLGLWLPWFGWRWWYYGWPFPNTYYVKASGDWIDAKTQTPKLGSQMVDNGLYYIWIWLKQTRLLYALPLAVAGIALAALRPRTARGVLGLALGLLALVYVPYTISVGGDFMGLHRFIMPLFVVAALAVVLGLERLVRLVPARPVALGRVQTTQRALVAIAACTALVGAFAWTQLALTQTSLRDQRPDHGIDSPAFLIVYTEDRAKIGRAMEPCFRDDDFSIVGGAGAQPYYARMRAIDVFGLVSSRIAHEEPRRNARAGHTKWASDKLLEAHDPTFVFSCYAIHPTPQQPTLGWCSGYWRARGYELVTMQVPGLEEKGTYYTFLAKKARDFQCPGRVH